MTFRIIFCICTIIYSTDNCLNDKNLWLGYRLKKTFHSPQEIYVIETNMFVYLPQICLRGLGGVSSTQEAAVLALNCVSPRNFGLVFLSHTAHLNFPHFLFNAIIFKEFKILSMHSLYGIAAYNPASSGSQDRWHLFSISWVVSSFALTS